MKNYIKIAVGEEKENFHHKLIRLEHNRNSKRKVSMMKIMKVKIQKIFWMNKTIGIIPNLRNKNRTMIHRK